MQTRETLAPRYKRWHLLLFHVPLTLVPWNFLLPSRARGTPRRAVYGTVASSGLREIINIGSYERARSCGENSADMYSRSAKFETAIFSSNIKQNDLCIRSRGRCNDGIFLQRFDISKRPFQSSHFTQKFRNAHVCNLRFCASYLFAAKMENHSMKLSIYVYSKPIRSTLDLSV